MYLNNIQTINSQSSQIDSQALCLAMLDEQRKTRRWSILFKIVGLTILSVFLMGIYSNQYSITQAKLTSSSICNKELNVQHDNKIESIAENKV